MTTKDSQKGAVTATASAQIQKVPFHGQDMEVIPLVEGDVGAIVRRLSESVGLDPDAQIARLARIAATGAKWACTFIVKVQVGGQTRDVVVLPRRSIPMWAATVDTARVAIDARALLVAYQDDASETLADRYLGPRAAALVPKGNGRPLTKRQAEILLFMKTFARGFGAPPTIREIKEHFALSSTNAVADHLSCMEKKGAIGLRHDGKARSVIFYDLDVEPQKPVSPAPSPSPPLPVVATPEPNVEAAELRGMLRQAIEAIGLALGRRPRRQVDAPSGQHPLPFPETSKDPKDGAH